MQALWSKDWDWEIGMEMLQSFSFTLFSGAMGLSFDVIENLVMNSWRYEQVVCNLYKNRINLWHRRPYVGNCSG